MPEERPHAGAAVILRITGFGSRRPVAKPKDWDRLREAFQTATPSEVGRRAHRVTGYLYFWGSWWCVTPRNPEMHKASPVELAQIRQFEKEEAARKWEAINKEEPG